MTIAPLLEEEEEDNDSGGTASVGAPTYGPDVHLIIPFQNENLYAYAESGGTKQVKTCPAPASWVNTD